MKKAVIAAVLALVVGTALAAPASGQTPPTVDGDDDRVTDQLLVRHDGGTDDAVVECNDDTSDPAPDDDPEDDDLDSNDGGGERQGNEPYSVVDPTDTATIVAGWNDYCLTDLDAGWEGFAYSRDGGESWTNSLVPGYPQDTSAEGQDSPLFGETRFAGDPIAGFNRAGDLHVGGIAFNRAGQTNGSVWVATYDTTPPSCAATTCPGYPVDYERTVIVGKGTPSRNFQGVFQDKPMLEVDRSGGEHDGNVYVCWSRFTGFGQNKLYFSRSTDGGQTFSKPLSISGRHSVQGCDIAVESDGDVFVTWRTFDDPSAHTEDSLAFAVSTNGGKSFGKAEEIRDINTYFPFDGSRDCGDGAELCPSEFVFHRVPLEPRVTADQTGGLPGVYLTYNAIRPGSEEDSATTYTSTGDGRVGQSLVYVIRTLDDGQNWSDPVAVDPAPTGHQFFPDIDAYAGEMGVVWQDNRTDVDAYSVQLPIGNTAAATSSGTDVVNTFFAHAVGGDFEDGFFGASQQVSDVGNQSEYEMFGNRSVPFYGDYNWISLMRDADDPPGTLFVYMTWTDQRDVVTGTDPREETQDGFDVLQCRELEDDGVTYGADNCPNAGGLDQNIFGNSATFSP